MSTRTTKIEESSTAPSGGGTTVVSVGESAPSPFPPPSLPQHDAGDTIDVDKMLVKDLRQELKTRGLKCSGRKADLQERLREYLTKAKEKREAADSDVEENGSSEQSLTLKRQADHEREDNCAELDSCEGKEDAGAGVLINATNRKRDSADDKEGSGEQLLKCHADHEVKSTCAERNSSTEKEDVGMMNNSTNSTVGSKAEAVAKKPIIGEKSNNKSEDWRIKAEERRKAALAIRASKRMKTESGDVKKPIITPVANPYSSSKKPSNPYAKKASATDWIPSVTAVPHSPANPNARRASPNTNLPHSLANPYTKKTLPTTNSTYQSMSTAQPKSLATRPNPKPSEAIPALTSIWGDCRLDLWEALCTCGGERKAPDTRMCRCLGVLNAGLGCDGCNAGVLLIKNGPRGNFWGCSQYKKRGCKHTKRFGPPHDAEAARRLADIKQGSTRERESWLLIADPFEKEWRSVCRCDGAKMLDTYECFMQSNGGCGMLPLCPKGCGGCLFLQRSKYGKGRWWGCSNYKNGMCAYRTDYIEQQS